MHCIAALAVLKQFWCRVIKRLRITLLCPWCYYILWWLSSIKIYKIGGSEALKQWLSSIRIIIQKESRQATIEEIYNVIPYIGRDEEMLALINSTLEKLWFLTDEAFLNMDLEPYKEELVEDE